ncbi:hypothetical protein [Colwellia sp. MB02u-6]|uniref:hypothetical protein n=1 Tax=Colwellia sp. MB02u-6 TaxID=2759824 RepID=UPI002175442A|nr:hypothetical protein [Colwellia sp. MB02u-6]
MAKKAHNSKNSTAKVVIGKSNQGINLLGSTLSLSGVRSKNRQHPVKPRALPGIEHIADASTAPASDSIFINYIDYCASQLETGNITDLDEFLAKPLLDWVTVRWINISPPHPYVINQFRQHFEFHTLAAEDVMHIPQRPRVELFDDHLAYNETDSNRT